MINQKIKHLPRILVLTSTFPRWENDTEPAFVFELSRRLTTAFDITVLAPRSTGSKNHETMAGLRIFRFPYFIRRWENLASHGGGILSRLRVNPLNYLLVPFFLLGQLWTLIRLLKKEKFEAIHAHWIIPQGLVVLMAGILTGSQPPLICTSHGGDLFALRGKFFYGVKRWIMNRSRGITVVSLAMKQRVQEMGVAPDKVRVISMGVDLKTLFVPEVKMIRSTRELLFVGRLVEKKGLDILLSALPKVLIRYPGVRLIVAGAGPLGFESHQLCRKLNLSDKVEFLGMVAQSRLPSLYQRAALAVFPFMVDKNGDQEGLGLVVVEAMGCRCPIIASDLPAIRDTVCHGKTGVLVPPGNIEQLADTIISAIQYPEAQLVMGVFAHQTVLEKFDWDVIVDQYAKYLRCILDSEF